MGFSWDISMRGSPTHKSVVVCTGMMNDVQILLATGMTLTGVGRKTVKKLRMKRASYSFGYKCVIFLCLLFVT